MSDTSLIYEVERYISFLKNLSKEELNSLSKKEKEIVFEIKNKQNSQRNNERLISEQEVNDIILKLNSMNERLEGENYLKPLKLSRQSLEIILKKLDIPYQKKDSISKLYDKIIESTIGYKLRSQAIQNNNLI